MPNNSTAYQGIIKDKATLESRFPGLVLHVVNKTPNSIFPFYQNLPIAQIYQGLGLIESRLRTTISKDKHQKITNILETLHSYYK